MKDQLSVADRFAISSVYSALISTALNKLTITVPELAAQCNLPVRGRPMADLISSCLTIISKSEHEQGRPLLSSLVIKAGRGPCCGNTKFFEQATSLGVFLDTEDRQTYWESEVKRVHDFWTIDY